MSEANAEAPVKKAGRNDPCPCGSGQKYKKCCDKKDRALEQAAKSTRNVEDIVAADSSPWDVYKVLVQIAEDNMFNLFWDLAHPLGPFRARFASAEDYFTAANGGAEPLPCALPFELTWIRHDGPDVLLLMERGREERGEAEVYCEIVTLKRNELDADDAEREVEHGGWRVWRVERKSIAKEGNDDVRLSTLGYEWTGRPLPPLPIAEEASSDEPEPAEAESAEEPAADSSE